MKIKYCPVCRDEKLLDGFSSACPGCHTSWATVWLEARKRRAEIDHERRRENRRYKKSVREAETASKQKKIEGEVVRKAENKKKTASIKSIRKADEAAIAERRAKELREKYWPC